MAARRAAASRSSGGPPTQVWAAAARPAGIVTERDLLRAAADPAVDLDASTVGTVMSSPVVTMTADTLVYRALGRMDRLAVPTLVIHGGADTVVPPTASAPLGNLSGVERHLLPQFRHESFNEVDKEQAWGIVTDWVLKQVETA